jgi:hypothetical protein
MNFTPVIGIVLVGALVPILDARNEINPCIICNIINYSVILLRSYFLLFLSFDYLVRPTPSFAVFPFLLVKVKDPWSAILLSFVSCTKYCNSGAFTPTVYYAVDVAFSIENYRI